MNAPALRLTDRSEYDDFSNRFEELKQNRLPHEASWREIGDFVATPLSVDPISRGAFNTPRARIDGTARIGAQRLSALLNGYLFNPFTPYFKARVVNHKLRHEDRVYLGEVDRRMHHMMSGARSSFRVAMGRALYNTVSWGNSSLWLGGIKGGQINTSTISVMDSWVDHNPETQRSDTMFRQFRLKAWRAAKNYPHSVALQELAVKNPLQSLTFVQAIEPNYGGKVGGGKARKPFIEKTWWEEGRERVDVQGYEEFPATHLRFYRFDNDAYGYGPGLEVLPWSKLIHAIENNNLTAEEQAVNPTLLDFSNGAINAHDRRPGATVKVDRNALFGLDKPLQRLYDHVDLRPSYQRVENLRMQIKEAFYVDWLTPRENGTQTATEVNDRRDVRMRGMAAVVAGQEHDFNMIGERVYLQMDRAGLLPPAPDGLHGADIIFDFISPLAMAMQQGEVEKLMSFLQIVATAVPVDPLAGKVPDVIEVVREAARALGIKEELIHSQEFLDQAVKAAQDDEAASREAEYAQSAAGVLRDGGQGAASLLNSNALQALQ
jgi:hypothetical protein